MWMWEELSHTNATCVSFSSCASSARPTCSSNSFSMSSTAVSRPASVPRSLLHCAALPASCHTSGLANSTSNCWSLDTSSFHYQIQQPTQRFQSYKPLKAESQKSQKSHKEICQELFPHPKPKTLKPAVKLLIPTCSRALMSWIERAIAAAWLRQSLSSSSWICHPREATSAAPDFSSDLPEDSPSEGDEAIDNAKLLIPLWNSTLELWQTDWRPRPILTDGGTERRPWFCCGRWSSRNCSCFLLLLTLILTLSPLRSESNKYWWLCCNWVPQVPNHCSVATCALTCVHHRLLDEEAPFLLQQLLASIDNDENAIDDGFSGLGWCDSDTHHL